MSGVQVIRIDDRDPSISYSSGSWSKGGNGNEYLSTTSRTNQVGATATIPFTGTKIMIYGTIDSTALGTSPVSLFSVDGGRATQFVERQINTGSQYQQKFYESADLSPGTHQLVITISSVPSVRASFTFDYAEYYVSPNVASTTTFSTEAPVQITTVVVQQSAPSDSAKITSASQTSLSSSASHLSSLASSSTLTGSLPSLTSPASSADASTNTSSAGSGNVQQDANGVTSKSKSSSSSTPAIVGAVVGVLVVLGILIFLFFILKRRRARRKDERLGFTEKNNGSPGRNTSVTPFPSLQDHSNNLGGRDAPVHPTSYVSEYYPSNTSASGRASSFDPSSSSSNSAGTTASPQTPTPNATYGLGAGVSKAAEARQERQRIEEAEDQPPPQYES